ncbi:hypothetical protein KBD45_00140 [Candidatus Dojkabacteria bacterium]|nr:hypothetical protein [Candidatus Dojkabacteria bacterium]
MERIIFETLNMNQIINFQTVIACFGIYVFLFWFMVGLWVFFDAKKRYRSKYLALLISGCVFLFSFPVLILYLLLRKENYESEGVPNISYEIDNLHIPTVPLADFVQNGEVKFRVEISIVPINKLEVTKQNNQTKTKDIKIDLLESVEENLKEGSDVDKKIKKNINKLLNLLNVKKNKVQDR